MAAIATVARMVSTTRIRRLGRLCVPALVTLVLLTPLASISAATSSVVRPILPPHEPAKNFRLSSVDQVLSSIDAARAALEGLAPLRFDVAKFDRLSVAEQVFVLSNLERTTRGLYPAMAMIPRLDSIATRAASRDADPTDEGKGFSSIWSSAPSGLGQYAFFADFGWMYDDGPPPQYIFRNVDCTEAGQHGCWGHRDNILSNPLMGWSGCPHGVLVTGTGFAARTKYGPSLTQIFEVACSSQVSVTTFTWRHAVSILNIPPSQSGLVDT